MASSRRSSVGSCGCSVRPILPASPCWIVCLHVVLCRDYTHVKLLSVMYSETDELIRAPRGKRRRSLSPYLPAGRREGSYWIVGDLQNNPGRSLFVRLTGPTSGPGAAGKFSDSATGEHGDLLDIIRERTGISRFPDLLPRPGRIWAARSRSSRMRQCRRRPNPPVARQRRRRDCSQPRCRSQARLPTPTSAPGASPKVAG